MSLRQMPHLAKYLVMISQESRVTLRWEMLVCVPNVLGNHLVSGGRPTRRHES